MSRNYIPLSLDVCMAQRDNFTLQLYKHPSCRLSLKASGKLVFHITGHAVPTGQEDVLKSIKPLLSHPQIVALNASAFTGPRYEASPSFYRVFKNILPVINVYNSKHNSVITFKQQRYRQVPQYITDIPRLHLQQYRRHLTYNQTCAILHAAHPQLRIQQRRTGNSMLSNFSSAWRLRRYCH